MFSDRKSFRTSLSNIFAKNYSTNDQILNANGYAKRSSSDNAKLISVKAFRELIELIHFEIAIIKRSEIVT